MPPTFRPHRARSRPHGAPRHAPRARLLAALTGVLVLLLAAGANAATVIEGWGSSTTFGPEVVGNNLAPTPFPVLEGATAAAFGSDELDMLGNAFVLTPSGVFSAGNGYLGFGGEVGFHGYEQSASFKLIPGTAGATAVAAGLDQTLILQSNGTVLDFDAGQPTPAPVAGLSDVTAIAAGYFFSLALEGNGSVWSWTPGATPSQIVFPTVTPTKATAIAAGGGQGLALLADGSVWAWGENVYGEVGNGHEGEPFVAPVEVIKPVLGAPSVTALTAGYESSYALLSNGSFEAWGANEGGQLGLGNGGGANVDTPTPTQSYPPLTQISAIGGTAYAIASSYKESVTAPAITGAVLILGETIQREGRLQGVQWLGVGSTGHAEIAAETPVLQAASHVPFYSHALGSFSAPEDVEVNSVGETTKVSQAHITGPDAGDFEIVGFNTTGSAGDYEPFPLTIGDLHVYIRFSPQGLGERFATLVVEGEGETADVQLAGYGTEPPANTPGATGPTGPVGAVGPVRPSSVGPAGPTGPAGKNGVIVFAAAASKASVRPGHVATLHFALGDGTTGGFPKTSLSVSAPKGLDLLGSKSATVASLGAGDSRTVALRLKVGAKARRGAYKVKVSWKLGGRTVTRTVQLRVT